MSEMTAACSRPAVTPGRQGWRRLFRLLWFAATTTPLFFLVPHLDPRELSHRFSGAVIPLLVLAAGLNLAVHVVQAGCWSAMLHPLRRLPFGLLLRYEFAAQSTAFADVAMGRDPLRARLLAGADVPPAATAALTSLRRIVRAAGIGVLAVAAPLVLTGLPIRVTAYLWLSTVVTIALVGWLVLLARRHGAARVPRLLRRLTPGLFCLRDARALLLLLTLGMLEVLIDAVAAAVVLSALHVSVSVGAAALVLFFVDMSVSLPVSPVNLGTFEAGALLGLEFAHVPLEAGAAFALVFHAQQNLPQLIAGLPLRITVANRRRRS
ncbi:lysylphosphatidylglycerol synthase transmembrane domain-containing protein [Actinoplanes sp. HUAS TT8]|uniref:lysylphosphatidylglycerol synthase transmembrane domain-containing protein n=1 Tax=Actinoplanes sp. HUAS TT8 TaxID=3447453 RepID=UPI003F522515